MAKNNLIKIFSNKIEKEIEPTRTNWSRVIGFRDDKFGVNEPTNLSIEPIVLTWNGQGAVTTNQLQKLRPRRR